MSSWLQSQGLHVNWVSPSRTFIGFNGAAADVGRTFQTQVNYYRVNGAQRFAVSSPPLIPEALLPMVKAVRGLYTLEEHPLHSAVNSRFSQADRCTSHFLAPADFATIYNIPDSLTGSGVAIGIVGRSRTDFADFANFRNHRRQLPNPKEIIPTAYGGVDPGPALTAPPAPGVSTGDQGKRLWMCCARASRCPQAQYFARGCPPTMGARRRSRRQRALVARARGGVSVSSRAA